MRFLRRSTDSPAAQSSEQPEPAEAADQAQSESDDQRQRRVTPGKGRPTPKRRDATGRRGPVAPPPRTQREAIKRARSSPTTLSKEERRAVRAERRAKMLAGDDDQYLLPRDKGQVRAYVRDLVDSRRNVMGMFMPMALVVVVSIAVPMPEVQQLVSLVTTAMLLLILIEAVMLGRYVNNRVRQRFPEAKTGSGLGFYAFTRATMMRRFRAPRPAVKRGELPRAEQRRR